METTRVEGGAWSTRRGSAVDESSAFAERDGITCLEHVLHIEEHHLLSSPHQMESHGHLLACQRRLCCRSALYPITNAFDLQIPSTPPVPDSGERTYSQASDPCPFDCIARGRLWQAHSHFSSL